MKKSLSRLLSLTLVLVMVLGMIPMASAEETTPSEFAKVTLSATSLDLVVGGAGATISVTEAIMVENPATNPGVAYKSYDTGVATVDASGNVTAVAAGNTTIEVTVTATGSLGSYRSVKRVSVSVTDPNAEETATLSLSHLASTAKVGDQMTLTATLTGSDDALNNVTWSIVSGSDCATLSSGKLTFTAAGEVKVKATYSPATGDPITAEHTITVSAQRFIVSMSDKTVEMDAEDPKMTVNISARTMADDAKVSTATYANWNSSNTTVATIDSTGALTLLKAGTSEISVDVTIDGEEHKGVKATLTVVNEGEITCAQDGTSTNGSSKQITPVLSGVPTDTAVDWTFAVVTGDITLSAYSAESSVYTTSFTVSRGDKYGIAAVKITAKWGEPERTAEKTIYLSFYDEQNFVVNVDSGVSSFTFNDTKVFSKVSSGLTNMNNPGGYSMMTLLSDGVAEGVALYENKASSNSRVGKITLPGGGVTSQYNPITRNYYDLGLKAYKLVFTVLSEGEYVLNYELFDNYSNQSMVSKKGTITIVTGEAAADIIYDVQLGGTVTLNEDDFEEFWKKYGTGTMSHVEFAVSYKTPYVPYYGAMYTDDTAKTPVLDTMDFEANYKSTSRNYDLDAVTYVANAKSKTEHVDTVDFTIYNTSGAALVGTLQFNVGNLNPFTDVKEGDYFYDAVLWAVAEGVTTGQTETTFAPNAACTRGQVVTFLWRAAGEPEPSSTVNKFTDVKKDDYYYKAVLWAVEKGITTGMTATTFAPSSPCTRAQVVTFLHRAAGKPTTTGVNTFTDVNASAYYYNAVRWAVKKGITNGMTATTFGSNNSCTRGQIVTFLYRYVES